MLKKAAGENGFTLVELIIVMLMSGLILAAASSAFIGLLSQSRIQGGIAESHENLIGLEMLRRDLESAGYGLAWDGLAAYGESAGNPFELNDAPAGAPRAVISQDNVATYAGSDVMFNGSDYLAIKAVNVASNEACRKCTTLRQGNAVRVWSPASENLENSDRVIVLSPRDQTKRPLIVSGGAFWTTYNNLAGFAPTDKNGTYLVYGINSSGSSTPRRPFNRADYYIAKPANFPSRCAPNTGILYKATMNHNESGSLNPQPLLDCVADMQVIFGLDNDENGSLDGYSSTITLPVLTAKQIRARVKEVRIYILTHEGSRDQNFRHPTKIITVGEFGLGRDFDLGTNMNYRWKVYQLVVKPLNLS